ncbi:MAG: 23S rRNA (guanosine(2251)-2'-O)-methyltransferase RlmB [Anaerovoracaceae bacterium]|jgi:23S rRNA (guanosine2251-2'-O)-methyltransferase
MNDFIYGRNPVIEALKSGRDIDKLLVQRGASGSVKKIEAMARERKIVIQYLERSALARISGTDSHQGVIAYVSQYPYMDLDELLFQIEGNGEEPFVVVLDELEDPHNLGAIIRTADGAGVHGIIIGKHRSVGLTPAAVKASAGAAEYVPVVKSGNTVHTIEKLKDSGLWICGCDMEGDVYWERDLTGPIGIVVGGEGSGIGRLAKQKCDFIVSIPMEGGVDSLNASNAAAILMYEIKRQRAVKEKKLTMYDRGKEDEGKNQG